jgi:cell wall assembly regulator SMI1
VFAVTDLTTALDAIVAEHRALGSPVGDFLRPGLPAVVVVTQLDALGLPAPPDVVELYGWADGTDEAAWQVDAGPAPFLRFLGDLVFPSLDDAAAWCRSTREMAQVASEESMDGLQPEAYWDPTWFPVFRPDRGEVAVTCSRHEPPTVHEVVWDSPDRRTVPSLTEFTRAAAVELRDHFVWLRDEKVLLRREVAELRGSIGGSGP